MSDMLSFKAGNLSNHFDHWAELTNDRYILDIVQTGLKLDFFHEPDTFPLPKSKFNSTDQIIIQEEIKTLLQKQVIAMSVHEPGEFISPIFTRPKKDGSLRMILNLKNLNDHVFYNHFKMESLDNVLNIIQPNVWMASVDLKDAFYTVPIHQTHQKFLKFQWNNKLYKFQAMPNGYAEAMRIFTKLLKPPFSSLRQNGYSSVVFVDDTYLQGSTYENCLQNVQVTINLLRNLGFTIHAKKSILVPTQKIEFLGFTIDSKNMKLTLSGEKRSKLIHKLETFKEMDNRTIRDIASLIGSLISTFPAIPNGPLHYRNLERFKTHQLKVSRGNFDASLPPLPLAAISEILWWGHNIELASRNIEVPPVDCTITTDASKLGWGATEGQNPTGGRWKISENDHINYLELKAAYFALKAYCTDNTYQHVRIRSDNCTAISYINNKGGIKSIKCDSLAKEIWDFCDNRKILVSAAYIPGKDNTTADQLSRIFSDQTEWMLQPRIFQQIIERFKFFPRVDLFASRLNHQLDQYVSWTPDPDSLAVDAFSISWSELKFYAYPPFSMIGQALSKITKDRATGIMIIPDWKTQHWFPMMLNLLTQEPIALPKLKSLITLPFNPESRHPLLPKTRLLAVHLSGNISQTLNTQLKSRRSSWIPGEDPPSQNTTLFSTAGNSFVLNGKRIAYGQL